MLQIKEILCDLLDFAYPESEQLEQYKRFYVEMLDKKMKSFHGDYNPKTHHIRIFNLYRADSAIIATTIHELTHHVDTVNRGRSDHSAEFYKIFRHLLYKALDMRLFSKEEFLNATKDAADSNKITKMITGYNPSFNGYKKDRQKIIVNNCFEIKDKLKVKGFHFNSVNKTWEKEVAEEEIEQLVRFLDEKKADYKITKATNLSFSRQMFIEAGKGSYEARDLLKEQGFIFSRHTKSWRIPIKSTNPHAVLAEYQKRMPNVEFKLV